MKTTAPIKTQAGEIAEFTPVHGLIVKLFRSNAYRGNREDGNGFRPTAIQKKGVVVWSFDELYHGTGKIAEFLLYGDDEYVIVVRDKFTVFEIVRITDYAHATCAKFGDKIVMVGGSSKELLLDMKIQAAEALEMKYWYSPAEGQIINRRLQAEHELRQAAKAEEAAEQQVKEAACEAIMARKTVEAWTKDGSRRYGTPVTGDEWKSLKDNTFCILMVDGQPSESFIVQKNGTQVKKIKISQVSATKPAPKKLDELPVAVDMMEGTVGGATKDFFVFASTEDVKRLHAGGLNSGTWVGVRKDAGADVTVYKVTKEGFNPIGVIKVNPATA